MFVTALSAHTGLRSGGAEGPLTSSDAAGRGAVLGCVLLYGSGRQADVKLRGLQRHGGMALTLRRNHENRAGTRMFGGLTANPEPTALRKN
uniref:Uncharacterized protein n=1 Tax=Knipowitschia caucasica TaxID=637954 RepID=A0AAV2IVL0_KNICA